MLRYFASGYRDFSTHLDPFSRRLNWEFMAIMDGECGPKLEVESAPPLMRGPSLWLMPRQLPYCWRSNGVCNRAVFHFAYLPEVLQDYVAKNGYICKPLSPAEGQRVISVAERIASLYYNPTDLLPLYCNWALMELSILALADVSFEAQPRHNNLDKQRVLQAEGWFREHLRRRPKIEEVASEVGVSASHLRRSFQRVHGCPPQDVFKKMRLHEAMRLLSDTDMTLEAVAASSGFSSVVDFHRCFKAEANVTPDVWRKRIVDKNMRAAPPTVPYREGLGSDRTGQGKTG